MQQMQQMRQMRQMQHIICMTHRTCFPKTPIGGTKITERAVVMDAIVNHPSNIGMRIVNQNRHVFWSTPRVLEYTFDL